MWWWLCVLGWVGGVWFWVEGGGGLLWGVLCVGVLVCGWGYVCFWGCGGGVILVGKSWGGCFSGYWGGGGCFGFGFGGEGVGVLGFWFVGGFLCGGGWWVGVVWWGWGWSWVWIGGVVVGEGVLECVWLAEGNLVRGLGESGERVF
jgi:hypothetical protein